MDQQTSGSKNYGTFTQWNSAQQKGAPTLCNSMDETGKSYAKWNKPDDKRQIPNDLTFNRNLINKTSKQNITKDTEIENRLTVARGERGGNFRGKGWRVYRRNNYKGLMDNNRGWGMETGGRWGGLRGWAGVGGKGRKLYLKNNKKIKLKKMNWEYNDPDTLPAKIFTIPWIWLSLLCPANTHPSCIFNF